MPRHTQTHALTTLPSWTYTDSASFSIRALSRPEIALGRLHPGSEKYKELHRELTNEKQTLRRALKRKVREGWTAEQAVDDIERQLQGIGFAMLPAGHAACCPQRPARKRLVEAISAPLGNTLKDQYRRRDNSINAVMDYCVVEEGPAVPKRNCLTICPNLGAVSDPPENCAGHSTLQATFLNTFDACIYRTYETTIRLSVWFARWSSATRSISRTMLYVFTELCRIGDLAH